MGPAHGTDAGTARGPGGRPLHRRTCAERAFGIFNLACGVALLVASVLAEWLWDAYGPAQTFYVGAAFTALAGIGLLLTPKRCRRTWQRRMTPTKPLVRLPRRVVCDRTVVEYDWLTIPLCGSGRNACEVTMTPKRPGRWAVKMAVALALFATVSIAHGQVYECTDSNGKTTYADAPCDAGSKPLKLEA